MRVTTGKGNDARKILTYYRVNFSIRSPYRVLCDGALLHHALSKKLYLREALPNLLGSPAQAVVTRCVVDELRSLGEATSGAALVARKLTRIPCAHENCSKPAAECVAAVVMGGNAKRVLLASNDRGVLNKVLREPGVPVIRIDSEGRFLLMPPGKKTRERVEALEKSKEGVKRPDEVRALEKAAEELKALREERRSARPKKRKRPSEPNPLSVKKKKNTQVVSKAQGGAQPSREIGNGPVGHVDDVQNDLARPSESDDCVTKEEVSERKPKRIRKRKPKPLKPELELENGEANPSNPGSGSVENAESCEKTETADGRPTSEETQTC